MEGLLLQVPGGVVGLSGVLVGPVRHTPPDAARAVPILGLGHGIGDLRDTTIIGPGISNLTLFAVLSDDLGKCVAETAVIDGIRSYHRICKLADEIAAILTHRINKREPIGGDVVHGVGWLGCCSVAAIESYRSRGGRSSTIREHLDLTISCHFGKLTVRDRDDLSVLGIGFDNQVAVLVATSIEQLLEAGIALKLVCLTVPAAEEHLDWGNSCIWP